MEDHDHGLAADLQAMMGKQTDRRQSLRWLLAGAALPMLGCGGGSSDSTVSADTTASTGGTGTGSSGSSETSSGSSGTSSGTGTGTCTAIPEETGGPYPADGTNSTSSGVVNVLNLSGIVRQDIRSSFGG